MKNIVLLLTILSLSMITSCKDDDDLNPNDPDSKFGEISFKADGQEIRFSSGKASFWSLFAGSEILSLSGATTDAKVIRIDFTILGDTTLQDFNYNFSHNCGNLGTERICGFLTYNEDVLQISQELYFSSEVPDGNLNIEISSIDYRSGGHIAGTFSGTVFSAAANNDSRTISDGKFNLKID